MAQEQAVVQEEAARAPQYQAQALTQGVPPAQELQALAVVLGQQMQPAVDLVPRARPGSKPSQTTRIEGSRYLQPEIVAVES